TPSSIHARGHASVPAGPNSRTPKITTLRTIPAICFTRNIEPSHRQRYTPGSIDDNVSAPMHTLAFLDPGHFHAALTLRERHPRVSDDIHVYAPPGRELDDFLALIDAFNRRPERPTAWRAVVRAGDRPLERLIADRPSNIVILAGRNDRKITLMRRLHGAGFHLLADKPWLAGPD